MYTAVHTIIYPDIQVNVSWIAIACFFISTAETNVPCFNLHILMQFQRLVSAHRRTCIIVWLSGLGTRF